jgi:hypothetical protein
MTRAVDLKSSTVTIRTKASGLLARLAHDLELDASRFSASIEPEGAQWRVELEFPVASIRVVGALKGGRVDRTVLSASDVSEIERKLRDEVLRGDLVRVRGAGDRRRGELTVIAPRGEQKLTVALTTEDRASGETVVGLATKVSLARLGVGEVKGPLGAFKIADDVEVAARLVLLPA